MLQAQMDHALGAFRNRLMRSAFTTWMQHKAEEQLQRQKLSNVLGALRNGMLHRAFSAWQQHAQQKQALQTKFGAAVQTLRNRMLAGAFRGWRERAATAKEHKLKVSNLSDIHCLTLACHTHVQSFWIPQTSCL